MSQISAHKMIAFVAVGMAEIDYDRNASDQKTGNAFYEMNPDRKEWVRQMAPLHIDDARDALYLVGMDDDTPIKDKIKIREALLLDEQIPGSNRRVLTATHHAEKQEIAKVFH